MNIPFPKTLLSMQSFLGILKYYSWFIEDFAIYASVLYELREADFIISGVCITRRLKAHPAMITAIIPRLMMTSGSNQQVITIIHW